MRFRFGLSVAIALLPVSAARAQGPALEHAPVACVVAERFPRLEACAPVGTEVARARAYFRAAGGPHWYWVEMKPDKQCLAAILPKPSKTTSKIHYYLEAFGPSFATYRTQDHESTVVSGPGVCGDRRLAGALASASMVVGAPAGAPTIPAGFSGTGVISASGSAAAAAGSGGGGLSGTTMGLIAGGVAAAGIGVAVAAGGDGGPPKSEGGNGTPPAGGTGTAPGGGTTPSPGSSPPPAGGTSVLGGRWQGTYTWDCRFSGGSGSAAIVFDLMDADGRLSGTATYLGGVSMIDPGSRLTASTGEVRIITLPSSAAVNNEFNGTLSGSTITGTTLNGDSRAGNSQGCSAPTGPSGTFSVSR